MTGSQNRQVPKETLHHVNNRTDSRSRFIVTMLCVPGRPMLTLVEEEELAERAHLRAPRPS